jgi:hypothetical protein
VVARFLDDPKSEALANPKNCDPNLIKFKKLLELWQCFLVRMNTVTAVQPHSLYQPANRGWIHKEYSRMKKILLASCFALGLATTPVSADVIPGTFTSDHCDGGCGPQPGGFATITGVDNGGGSVTLTITPLNGNGLVNTGHDTFAFNLIDNPTITYSGLPTGFTVVGGFGSGNLKENAGSIQEDGFQSFEYAINAGGNGANNPFFTPLTFTITGTGLTLASFNELSVPPPNGGDPAFMVIDIISKTTGNTGLVDISSVPGPIVGAGLPGLAMACTGLVALARRRRKLVV